MKTKFLFFSMLCFECAFAGTPAMSDASILYGVALILLGLLIGTPYLIKFIKQRRKAMHDKDMEKEAIDSSDAS